MDAQDNRALLQRVFAATEQGDGRPFVDALADDVRWTIMGSGSWSGVYNGKADVVGRLLRPLAANFTGANRVRAGRMIAEGDMVVVEGQNLSVTRSGEPYANTYCWIFTFRDARVVDIVEHTDTELIARVLLTPEASHELLSSTAT